jgi:predicted metalloprotease with PDZ domain
VATVQVLFDVTHPETHLVRVTQKFPAKPGAVRRLRMAAWVPGSYKIRDFGRHVQDLKAKVAGKFVDVKQPTKDEWVIPCNGKAIEVTFDVYARELTVDTSHVTADHAHLFPATLLLYDGLSRNEPHKVRVKAPRGWKLWSGLETKALNGTLEVAENYDHLIDCPIEVGPPEDYHVGRFTVRGRTHRHVVWRAPPGIEWTKIEASMWKLCSETIRIFGEAPYKHYTFLTHVAADHGGGLEHRNSTVLGADPVHLQTEEKIETRYLPLVAHEFFHTWNVKRILPAAFQPYDLQQEVYTDLLWLFEGFTSYYELPILYRAKVIGEESFAKMMGEDLEMYRKALGRKRISVSQASRLTWTLLYQPHEHNVNRNVSYYSKGMWVGLCIDAELRRRGFKEGLDAVMRHAWRKHGRTGMGVTDDAFSDLVEQATGHNLKAKINAWTHGTEELPIERSLKILGWDVKAEWKDPKRTKGLGVEFKPGTSAIARIWEDRPAFTILQPDDELVAANGYKWKPETFGEQVAAKKVGDKVGLAVFREGRLRIFQVPLAEMPKEKYVITKRKKHAAAARRRKAWIGEGRHAPKKAKKSSKRSRPSQKAPRPSTGRKIPARKRVA